ncbi:MAG TPA: cupin domain-containing protein [Verrucomicrobiota bacterium]|nr:cupin domain-containing protein [Verrucomicrobiota bacterium]
MECCKTKTGAIIVRTKEEAKKQRSTCGYRYRLISKEDKDVAAYVHIVDIQDSKPHYHKRTAEIYYVLEGDGEIILDGKKHQISKGSIIHIPPDVVHSALGKMQVLVVGIPDISEEDIFFPDLK